MGKFIKQNIFFIVQINKDEEVTVFLNSTLNRETICGDGVTLSVAENLCRLAGQGYTAFVFYVFKLIDLL